MGLVGMLPSVAVVAAERETQTIEGWGEVVDPMGDCRVEEQGGAVSITVPGTYHDLHFGTDAPRVLQDITGDFTAQVRVRRFPKPAAKSSVNPQNPVSYVSGGLVVWQDEKNYLRLQRAANGDSGFVGVFSNYIERGEMPAFSRHVLPDEDIWLRIERRNGDFALAYSLDGQEWTAAVPKGEAVSLKANVRVGVFAINATIRPITHEFTDFAVNSAPPAP